ncbi:MAG: biotin--[acetyl-CoA-carboxylase] ligase [Saprospiraceae bacterium]|nr:biotin--[acetyl-CoA-carboxylase] ligase [Saprospiraceae bacterium]
MSEKISRLALNEQTNLLKNILSSIHNTNIVGKVLLEFESLPSTNTYAVELLSTGQPAEGTVIYAHHQTSGRGQMGTQWETAAGLNLTLSVILRPIFLSVQDQFYLNKAVSLAVYQVVNQYFPGQTRIKWPNDIYLKDQKVGGILIQNGVQGSFLQWSVLGLGLNINQDHFSDTLINATSFCKESKQIWDLYEIRTQLFRSLDSYYSELKRSANMMDDQYVQAL